MKKIDVCFIELNQDEFKKALIKVITNRLVSRRDNAGITQKELANKLQIATSSVSGFERGERLPAYLSLVDFRKALNIKMCDIIPSTTMSSKNTFIFKTDDQDADEDNNDYFADGFISKYRQIKNKSYRLALLSAVASIVGEKEIIDFEKYENAEYFSPDYEFSSTVKSRYAAILGKRFEFCRELLGLGAKEFAEKAGINKVTYYGYEAARRVIEIDTLYKFAVAAGQEVYDLIDIDLDNQDDMKRFFEWAYINYLFSKFDQELIKKYSIFLNSLLDSTLNTEKLEETIMQYYKES